MAVKIVRHPNQIAIIGAPSSAGAHGPGAELAPAAFRAAGLVEKLQQAGYQVNDLGDAAVRAYAPDEEFPRARNTLGVLALLNDLRPRVELAVKSGALVIILGGDCTVALATLAGIRRYFNKLSLLYIDRDADLNTPASTPSGCLHGMGVAHITGRGAPELIRFWNDPPLVREPDVALFGLDRTDPAEESFLAGSAMQRYRAAEISRRGAAAAAKAALDRIQAGDRQLVIHFDVDVISSEDLSAASIPAPGGLRLAEVKSAFEIFATGKNLTAIEITEFDPSRDSDGSAARAIVDILVSGLAARLAAHNEAAAATAAASAATSAPAAPLTSAATSSASPAPPAPPSFTPPAPEPPPPSAPPEPVSSEPIPASEPAPATMSASAPDSSASENDSHDSPAPDPASPDTQDEPSAQ